MNSRRPVPRSLEAAGLVQGVVPPVCDSEAGWSPLRFEMTLIRIPNTERKSDEHHYDTRRDEPLL